MPKLIRRTAIFQGTVQGVGFRATTSMLAKEFRVSGTVRNLPDGSVEVVCEGQAAETKSFVQRVEEQLRHRIHTVDSWTGDASGQYDGFRIAY